MMQTAPGTSTRRDLPMPSHDWAYFFDLDGTLVELVAKPWGVDADEELRSRIAVLARVTDGAVAVITGRPITDVDRLFPDIRLPVAGQHGVERRTFAGDVRRHRFPVEQLDVARQVLQQVVLRHPELLLEDKGLSLALHYRQAPRLASYAHRVMNRLRAGMGTEFCVQRGKRVVELKPAGRDKGMAIREFMDEPPFSGRRPVFIGDDVTDEHGFEVVNAYGGLSIKVGRGPTLARRQLANVRAVRAWLAQDPAIISTHRAGAENLTP